MELYEASGLSVAPAATGDLAYCQLWNANTTKSIFLREFAWTQVTATGGKIAMKRTTARGTNTTTVTGVRRNDMTASSTGTLDLTWSVEATKAGNYIRRSHYAGVIGAGVMWTWWTGDGLTIPQATGVAFVVPTAVAGAAGEVYVVFEE